MKVGAAKVRRDPYHGWRLYWQGCPDPLRQFRFMYRAQRNKGWDRRVSLAVAWTVVIGGMRSFRYATRRDYLPSRRPNALR